jgi:hypothetical protein
MLWRLSPQTLCVFYHFRKRILITHLKNVDQGSGQVLDPEPGVGSAGRRKSGAYTVVCEHFEPTRNTAMGT